MDNPFKIFVYLWRSRRPSRMTDMPAVRNTFWLRKGYAAMTFFGTIITSSQWHADRINRRDTDIKRHEMIHLRQAQSLHDSWLLFYVRYLWYYLRALPLNRKMRHAAYRLNPFELEAYAHMDDPAYLDQCRDGATEWRQHAKKKPKDRLNDYINNKYSWNI